MQHRRKTLDSRTMKTLSPMDRLLAACALQALNDAGDVRLSVAERDEARAFVAEIRAQLEPHAARAAGRNHGR